MRYSIPIAMLTLDVVDQCHHLSSRHWSITVCLDYPLFFDWANFGLIFCWAVCLYVVTPQGIYHDDWGEKISDWYVCRICVWHLLILCCVRWIRRRFFSFFWCVWKAVLRVTLESQYQSCYNSLRHISPYVIDAVNLRWIVLTRWNSRATRSI